MIGQEENSLLKGTGLEQIDVVKWKFLAECACLCTGRQKRPGGFDSAGLRTSRNYVCCIKHRQAVGQQQCHNNLRKAFVKEVNELLV